MRAENWHRRLDDGVNELRTRTFAWGDNDCCTGAAFLIYEITGVDIAAGFRGTYSTQAEAEAILEAVGGMVALVQSVVGPLGWTRTRPSFARRGDLVVRILPETGKPSLGVCLGRDAVFPAVGGGVAFFPMNECKTAWRVE